jgi:hypothetical protein
MDEMFEDREDLELEDSKPNELGASARMTRPFRFSLADESLNMCTSLTEQL